VGQTHETTTIPTGVAAITTAGIEVIAAIIAVPVSSD
jgi:hypothetical protein